MSQPLNLAKTSSQNLILAKTSFLDFCHLNEAKYALRIADYDDSHLKRQEAVKTRQIYGGMVSIASGAAGAVITHGTTLVVCAIGARRIFVACRKLKLIKEQLEKRGIDPRPFMNRDWMIPVAAGLIGAGIGFGIDFGLAGLIPGIVVPGGGSGSSLSASFVPGSGGSGMGGAVHHVLNALPAPDPSVISNAMLLHPTALQEASAFANNPGIAFHDFGQGIAAQLHAVFGHSHELIAPPSDGTLSGALGFVSGLHAAQTVEHSVAALLGSESLKWMSERLDADSLIPRMTHNMGCKRLAFSLALLCSSCDIPIDKGVFYRKLLTQKPAFSV